MVPVPRSGREGIQLGKEGRLQRASKDSKKFFKGNSERKKSFLVGKKTRREKFRREGK